MNTDVRELMLAGAHFGHRARFWNPQMARYIYGKYHSTHIINLDHTIEGMQKAAVFLQSVAASGGTILFLCTKNAAADAVEESAKAVSMPYVNRRWLGGILTNFKTTRNSVDTLKRIEEEIAGGVLKHLTKKEGIKLLLSKDKLERAIGGIRDMDGLPDALFVIDSGWHKGAIREAKKLAIPIVAVVDTNHSPDDINYVIPGNDDSRQAISIYAREMSVAIDEGKRTMEANLVADVRALGADGDEHLATKPVEEKKKTKIVTAKNRRKDGTETSVIVEETKESPAAARKRAVAKSAKPADDATTESVESAKPAEAEKPAEEKPAKSVKTVKVAKPAEEKPAETAKVAKPAEEKPAETAEAEKPAEEKSTDE